MHLLTWKYAWNAKWPGWSRDALYYMEAKGKYKTRTVNGRKTGMLRESCLTRTVEGDGHMDVLRMEVVQEGQWMQIQGWNPPGR